MHEIQTVVSDVRGVCPSVCLPVCLPRMHRMTPHDEADLTVLHCAGTFGAAFAKSLWPLV